MKRLVLALAATAVLAAPTAALTLDMLLPRISFPDDAVTSSSKGCGNTTVAPVCKLHE